MVLEVERPLSQLDACLRRNAGRVHGRHIEAVCQTRASCVLWGRAGILGGCGSGPVQSVDPTISRECLGGDSLDWPRWNRNRDGGGVSHQRSSSSTSWSASDSSPSCGDLPAAERTLPRSAVLQERARGRPPRPERPSRSQQLSRLTTLPTRRPRSTSGRTRGDSPRLRHRPRRPRAEERNAFPECDALSPLYSGYRVGDTARDCFQVSPDARYRSASAIWVLTNRAECRIQDGSKGLRRLSICVALSWGDEGCSRSVGSSGEMGTLES